MNAHPLIFILALFGIAESIYLFYQRKKKRPPVCVIGNDCAVVWESPYSKTFGVGNEVLGIIFYATMAVLEYSIVWGTYDPLLPLGEMILLAGGLVMSCYFLYVQWHLIRAWCFWCTLSVYLVWGMVWVWIVL